MHTGSRPTACILTYLPTYLQQMDGVNECIKIYNLPHEMGQRLREYLHNMKAVHMRE